MNECPHTFVMTDSPWDPSALDNGFEKEFHNTVTELPEVKEQCDGAVPHIDGSGFLWTQKDHKSLCCTQDKFVAASVPTAAVVTHDMHCDASSSGAARCDDTGTMTHDCIPMTHFETVATKLSAWINFASHFPIWKS